MAKIIGVTQERIHRWEQNMARPAIKLLAKLYSFLEDDGITTKTDTLENKIYGYRVKYGLSRKAFGKLVGASAPTVGAWEMGVCLPQQRLLHSIQMLLENDGVPTVMC